MSKILKTDVCIVGAGPAGASTSLMLAKLKIRHVIIDKATFPRDKTCGDGLILYAYKAMSILDDQLLQDFLNHPKFLHSKQGRLHINNDLNVLFKESDDRGSLISYAKRIDFDHFLVSHLSKEYATTEFGNEVKRLEEQADGVLVKLKDGKQILAKVVVGADGIQSVVSRKLAKNSIDRSKTSTFINSYFEGVEGLPKNNEAEVRMYYKKIPLFFYIFPLADNQVNVSLGGNAESIQKHGINLKEEVEHIIKTHPKVAHKFTKATQVGNWRGWGIPCHFEKLSASGSRFLLVGDAAGLANAFYKEGVGTGMMSGILCARKIAECIEQDDFSAEFLASYQTDLQNEFGRFLKFSELAMRFAKYRRPFAGMASLFRKRVERGAPAVIKRKSC